MKFLKYVKEYQVYEKLRENGQPEENVQLASWEVQSTVSSRSL